MLTLKDIYSNYGEIGILHSISLSVMDGEMVAVVGSNGAGKTTLLRTISGLLKPVRGTIHFSDSRIDGLTPNELVKRGLVMVPEGRKLFFAMTVMENLEMGVYLRSLRSRKEENLDRVFGLFPRLSERKNQIAGTLSGGEQQMLAIGRGLMSSPKLLMLDEVSLGISPVLTKEIMKVIQEINSKGTSILLVEQNVQYALEMSERAYVLEMGSIVLSGKAKQIMNDDHVKQAYLGL